MFCQCLAVLLQATAGWTPEPQQQHIHQAEFVIQHSRSLIANTRVMTKMQTSYSLHGGHQIGRVGGSRLSTSQANISTCPVCRSHQGSQQTLPGRVVRSLELIASSLSMLPWATNRSKRCSQDLHPHYETLHVACRLSRCRRQSFSSSCRHATSARRA